MNKKMQKIVRSAAAGLLALTMLVTDFGGNALTAQASGTVSASESSKTEQRIVTLGNFENGSLAFSDSGKSSEILGVGEIVTVNATPKDGYILNKVAILDESDNQYSFTRVNNQITFSVPEYDVKVYAQFTEGTYTDDVSDPYHMQDKPAGVSDEDWIAFRESLAEIANEEEYVENIDMDTLDTSIVDAQDTSLEDSTVFHAYDATTGSSLVVYDVDEQSDYYVGDGFGVVENSEAVSNLPEGTIVDNDTEVLYIPKESVDVNKLDETMVEGFSSLIGTTSVIFPALSALVPVSGVRCTSTGSGYSGILNGTVKKMWFETLNGRIALCLNPGRHSTGMSYDEKGEIDDFSDLVPFKSVIQNTANFLNHKRQTDAGNFNLYYVAAQSYLWNLMVGVTDETAIKQSMLTFFQSRFPGNPYFQSIDGPNQSIPVLYMEITNGVSSGITYATVDTDIYWITNNHDGAQRLLVWDYNPLDNNPGGNGVIIQKFSSDEFTSGGGNPEYSLAGAQFLIHCSQAWDGHSKNAAGLPIYTQVSDTITTDSDGIARYTVSYSGSYTITEVSAPTGFSIAEDVGSISFNASRNSDGSISIGGSGSFAVYITDPVKYGSLKLVKRTTNSNISGGNTNYSYVNATYKFTNISRTDGLAYTRKTDDNGEITLPNIPMGTYRIEEVDSSDGYAINPNSWTVHVGWNGDNEFSYTVTDTTEIPQRRPVSIMLEKYDHEQRIYHGSSNPQGDATMLNAIYHFQFYQETNLTRAAIEGNTPKHLLFEFDAKTIYKNGKNVVDLSEKSSISNWVSYTGATLDGMYDGVSGANFCVPYGTLYVYEKIPPVGYTLNDIYVIDGNETYHVPTDQNGTVRASYVWNNPDTKDAPGSEATNDRNEVNTISYLNKITYSEESMILGSVEVTKRDNQNETITPQGDARLWSKFYLYNMSAQPVWVDLDHNGVWDEDEEFGPNELITTIYTDKNTRQAILAGNRDTQYWADLDGDGPDEGPVNVTTHTFNKWAGSAYSTGILPYGTYRIVEVDTDNTYRLVPWEKTFTIGSHNNGVSYNDQLKSQSQIVKYNTVAEGAALNDVKRGTVVVTKFDNDFREYYYSQGDADFAGAKFEITNASTESVYDPDTRKECKPGQVFCHIITDETGRASTVIKADGSHWKDTVVGDGGFLPIGTYTIREVEPPNGYRLNTEWNQKFSITYDNEVVYLNQIYDLDDDANKDKPLQACGDDVQRAGIELYKSDNDRVTFLPHDDERFGQGDAHLSGAVFAVINMSRHDVFINGQRFKHGSLCYTFTTDENGYAASDLNTFPIGTYYIYEVMAPSGYFVDSSWTQEVYVREDGKMYTVGDINNNPIKEAVYRAGIIGNKIDAELDTAYAQGDASLNGAEISIINRSDYSVYVEGKWYEPGEVCYKTTTTWSDSIQATDGTYEEGSVMEPGWWKTDKHLLPYGTYEVIESKPSAGYNLNKDYSVIVKVRQDSIWYDISKTSGTLPEQIIRGDVQVQKWDKELDKSEATGGKDHGNNDYGADMNGIEFTITNQSKHDIVYNGQRVTSGSVVCKIITHWNEEVGAYTAETENKALPYGTYTIQETKTNNSYVLTDGEARTFKITEEGKTVTVDADGKDLVFKNEVNRGDIEFRKIADGTSKRMSTLWVITNNTTGERHVIAADQNGEYYSASDFNAHTNNTNGNDGLLARIDAGETIAIADADFTAGVWFSVGEAGSTSAPDDARGAFPYGHYTLQEVRTDSNDGYTLQGIDFWIYRNNRVVDLGTITDDLEPKFPAIDTVATFVKDGDVNKVTDTVSYTDLTVGQTYKLVGTLIDYETGKAVTDTDGNAITAEKTFTATTVNGKVENVFTFDWKLTQGKKCVVYEILYIDGISKIAGHTDLEDADQTVVFPGIKDTTATDSDTKDHDSKADGSVKITDLVEYAGLVPGKTYILKGTLMDKDTHSEALDDFGNEIVSTVVFTPTEPDGKIEVTFEFSGASLEGHTVVVFEILAIANIVNGNGSSTPDKGDTDAPANPDAGNTDKDSSDVSGGDVSGGDVGKPGNSTKPSTSGKDVTKVDDKTYVDKDGNKYEMGDTVGDHSDWDDAGQTVKFPKIRTTALGELTGTHEANVGVTTIRDTVHYKNLLVNESYTLTGTLMYADTEEPVLDADGNPYSTSVNFIPTTEDGDALITYDVPAEDLAGKTIVVYEVLSRKQSVVASHQDAADTEQYIYFPKIGTTALANDTTRQDALAGNIKITDTVAYENVQVGQTYTVTGTLMDANSKGYIFTDEENRTPVQVTATFTATETSGTVDVVFEGEASRLAGTTIVVFESLFDKNGVEVAHHNDATDTKQYIYIPEIGTTLLDAETGINETMAKDNIVLTDTIAYKNLFAGEEYIVTTRLVDKNTEKDVVDAVVTRFAPETTDGEVKVKIEIPDGKSLAGKSLVCFESIAPADLPDYVVAKHEDIEDENQTVTIPEIRTTAASKATGNDEMIVGQDSIIDTVTYKNLRPGNNYTVTGTLINKATGEAILGTDGKPITAKASLVPTEADGSVGVVFNVDTTQLKNMDIVCYETLTRADITLAEHHDKNDESQTVHVPDYSTLAVFANGIDETAANGTVTINDKVIYKNLRVGETYVASGSVMDASTGTALLVNGKTVTAQATFKPTAKDGETTVSYTFDATGLGGKNLVIYTELSRNNVQLMADHVISNADETVHFPVISTELKATGTGAKEVLAGTDVSLTDTITFTNLTPGREYKITGTLVKKSNGQTFATTEVKFTPTNANGTVDIIFKQDTSSVAGEALVAYETITRSNGVVAEHKDINDEKQTVSFPKIGTSAICKETGSKMLSVDSDSVTLVDTVTYSNLVKGHSYTVTTTLIDKSTGKAVDMGENANNATTTFTANETSGKFDVTMTVNPKKLIGKDLVFFETMTCNGATVAKHENVNDESQTVHIMSVDTKAFASDMRSKTIDVKKSAEVVDTITYTNLVPGTKYYAHAWLMNKSANSSVADVTVEFTPSSANGTVDIKIPVDTSSMNGVTLVVYEYVYDGNGKLLGCHNDLNDADQTVTVQTVTKVQTGVQTVSTPMAGIMIAIAVLAVLAVGFAAVSRRRKIQKARKDSESEE